MLNITELDDLVCADLDRKSLLQCALVSKEWYASVMPFLFKNIPELKTPHQKESFRRLVLEDFHLKEAHRREKQHRKQREKRQKQRQKKREQQSQQQPQSTADVKNSGTAQQENHTRQSLLARYGGCIRTIPKVEEIMSYLEAPMHRPESCTLRSQEPEEPAAFELLVSFLSRCICLWLPLVKLNEDHFEEPDMLDLLATYIVPAAVHLVLDVQDDPYHFYDSDDSDDEMSSFGMQFEGSDDEGDSDDDSEERHPMSPWNFKQILACTSSKLEKLTVDISSWDTTESDTEIEVAGRKGFLTGLKELRINGIGKELESIKSWDWLWKHATSLQNMRIERTFPEFTVSLIRGIAVHLHHLENIHIGRKIVNTWNDKVHFPDAIIAKLLSAGRDYKSIYIDITARAGLDTIQAIARHYLTLTEFTIEIGTGDDSFLVDLLAFSPNLRKLVTIKNGEYPYVDDDFFPQVPAEKFADLDSSTKTYRPWACEATLETLHVKIVDIPIKYNADEVRRLSLQTRVCGRLARLTNLQVLWLGHCPAVPDVESGEGGEIMGDVQEESLDLTLESGLTALGALTRLRQLNLHDVYHDIGVAEVQWMVESWPELETIWVVEGGPAYDWLKSNHPSLVDKPTDLSEDSDEDSSLSD
ncbi:hypothetical protein CPB97_009876 [Podila verticillata]|nr:hypothetical protein CPB97_009876 [Podila verticillata]